MEEGLGYVGGLELCILGGELGEGRGGLKVKLGLYFKVRWSLEREVCI